MKFEKVSVKLLSSDSKTKKENTYMWSQALKNKLLHIFTGSCSTSACHALVAGTCRRGYNFPFRYAQRNFSQLCGTYMYSLSVVHCFTLGSSQYLYRKSDYSYSCSPFVSMTFLYQSKLFFLLRFSVPLPSLSLST